jgi:biotin carboxylase
MGPDYLTYARSKIGMKKLFADAGVPLMAGINTTDKERVRIDEEVFEHMENQDDYDC